MGYKQVSYMYSGWEQGGGVEEEEERCKGSCLLENVNETQSTR